MDELQKSFSLPFFLACSLIIHTISTTTNTISSAQIIRDGEMMISSGGMFELGFFSPGSSTNRYVGMWYKNMTFTPVICVANRESPLPNKSGVLKVIEPGLLAILNDTNGIVIWSSNMSALSPLGRAAMIQLQESLQFTWILRDILSHSIERSVVIRSTVSPYGVAQGWNWIDQIKTWNNFANLPVDVCDNYHLCGEYGMCNIRNSPPCGCLSPPQVLVKDYGTLPMGKKFL